MRKNLRAYPFLKSVRIHLVILVLIAIIPALGIILYTGYKHRLDAVREAEMSITMVLNHIAAEHERTMESTRQLLATLSKLPEVRGLTVSGCNKLFEELLAHNPIYANLAIVNPQGIIISSGIPFTPRSIKHRKYFKDAITTKSFSVGEYSIGAISEKPSIQYALPILDEDHRLKGVVVASVNIARYGEIFLKTKVPPDSILSLTDHKGIQLFRSPHPEKYIGKLDCRDRILNMTTGPEQGIFSQAKDGENYIFAYKLFRLTENASPYLFINVGISEKKALAKTRGLLVTNMYLFGIAFFLAVTSALIIGRAVISGKLETLVHASRKLGIGDLKSRTGLPHGESEFGYLAKTFDEMADELERKEYERKLAEEALTMQFQFLQNLIDAIPNGVFHKNKNGLYQGCNKAFLEYIGIPRESIIGKSVFEVHPPNMASIYNRMDIELFAHPGIRSYETTVQHKSGKTRDILLSKATYNDQDGHVAGLIGAMVDITDRTQSEKKLAYERHNFSSICENAPFGMIMLDSSSNITYINPKFRETFGYDLTEIPDGKTWLRKAYPDQEYRHIVISSWLKDTLKPWTNEAASTIFTVTCKDGTKKIVSFIAAPLQGGRSIVSSEDITTRQKAEETLKESEETLRALINATRETLLLIDIQGTVLVANEVVAQRLKTTVQELVGTCLYDYFDPEVARVRKGHFDMVFASGEYIHYADRREGKLFDTYVYPVFSVDGSSVSRIAISAHDITQRAKAEEEKIHLESQLRQSQKMEAIGTLAGGIAHDFNNILTAIIGYGSLLQMNMEAGDSRKIYADRILTSSQKAATLTQSLLAFGRKQVIELKPRKVSEMIRETEELLKRLLTEDIEFRVVIINHDVVVKADATQIAQVLMNLVTNARDAMPKGGKLTLEAKKVSLDSKFSETHRLGETGDYASISVTDTGVGMDQETMEKIFEPFFTTKEVGKGTGLGLSMAYGIVKQHNGYISVSSEPGSGTTFVIYLPIVKAQAEETSTVREDMQGGDETILVAEDNDEVRRLAKEILTASGYTVIEAIDGEDAVLKFSEHEKEIDLLILDVVMPKMNGKETHDAIKTINPCIRAIFTSGYTVDIVFGKGIHNESINFISKPLSPGEMLRKVRQALNKQAPA
ncbi:MAG: PAS domain S-box protein [Syntrophobacterales bacterium]|jgi:PAS domain S-box-containing protein|nr:PAS domain S-box protein [Syntrophobacterales bacterium]